MIVIVAYALAPSSLAARTPQKSADIEPIRRMEHRYRAAKTLQATFMEAWSRASHILGGRVKCVGNTPLQKIICF
jgi:hypothetical protein